mmetsp:Transcript_41025/g.121662  ORF Transcript_41025/g.121662 Transcript_41025/m.121662 type:complete len:240 (-) Transcript_41025:50-769(-)
MRRGSLGPGRPAGRTASALLSRLREEVLAEDRAHNVVREAFDARWWEETHGQHGLVQLHHLCQLGVSAVHSQGGRRCAISVLHVGVAPGVQQANRHLPLSCELFIARHLHEERWPELCDGQHRQGTASREVHSIDLRPMIQKNANDVSTAQESHSGDQGWLDHVVEKRKTGSARVLLECSSHLVSRAPVQRREERRQSGLSRSLRRGAGVRPTSASAMRRRERCLLLSSASARRRREAV